MVSVQKIRLHNPQRTTQGARKSEARKNPGELLTLGFINPQGAHMNAKKKQTTKKKPARRPVSNPQSHGRVVAMQKAYKPKHRPRAKNPGTFSLSQPIDILKASLFALLGLVVTRQLPQMILKQKNAGPMGYAANAGTAALAGIGTAKFVSKPAGAAVGIGGGLYLISRFLTEQVSPVGKYLALAGVGDAAAAPSVGRLRELYFPYPVMRDKQGNPIIPPQIDAARAIAAAQAAAGNAAASPLSAGSKVSGFNRMRAA